MKATQRQGEVERLERMMLIRSYEEKLVSINQATGAAGTCTSVGQEACAVGVISALGANDRILTNHRSAGHLLARGADPGRMMAEVLGRKDGYCKGNSGSLHISDKSLGVVLTSTIVGAELALATGVALAQKSGLGERGAIVATFFGDGAACEGIFHEALNLATTWELPLLFVCENNQWQAFVHRSQTMPGQSIRAWAESHGLEAISVDGNDVESVRKVAQHAAERIRQTGKPHFIELMTYRQRGHFEPDDQAYVDKAELREWLARDPIDIAVTRLVSEGAITPAELTAMRERVNKTIDDAASFAQASEWPNPSQLQQDVYA